MEDRVRVKIRFREREYSFEVEGERGLVSEAAGRVQELLRSANLPGSDAEVLLALLMELALEEARLRRGIRELLREMEVSS